ncbi:MAG: hypothetical protein D6708_05030 [Candidatus Dadabacteria bacterium]|nr:MAG: hypothetical protein D6708_05030 [Candidatus Dadabacteria bacterium]
MGHHGHEHEACEACQTNAGHHLPALSPREVDRRYRFRLETDPAAPRAGEEIRITVRIETADGRPATGLQVHHERLVHFLVVSENLEEFHHLHPEDFGLLTEEARAQARFTFPVTLRWGGRYVIAVDAVDRGQALHKELELSVEGPPQPPTRWDLSRTRSVDGLTCVLHTMPDRIEARNRVEANIEIEAGGAPVTDLEPYLGVLAHLAIFRENASGSAHTHGGGPEFAHQHFHKPTPGYRGPKLYWGHVFKAPGRYRIFAQFRRGGRVYTVPFDVEVHAPHEGR